MSGHWPSWMCHLGLLDLWSHLGIQLLGFLSQLLLLHCFLLHFLTTKGV